jgi:hypothetical protein
MLVVVKKETINQEKKRRKDVIKKEPCRDRALMNSRMPGFLGRVIRYGRHRLCVAPSDYRSDSSAWLMVVLYRSSHELTRFALTVTD